LLRFPILINCPIAIANTAARKIHPARMIVVVTAGLAIESGAGRENGARGRAATKESPLKQSEITGLPCHAKNLCFGATAHRNASEGLSAEASCREMAGQSTAPFATSIL
jgi:hypothetical protein